MVKKLILSALVLMLVGGLGGAAYVYSLQRSLPEILKVEDYKPRLVSTVYARDNRKIGEFFNEENRILTPYEKIPKTLINAFIAIEDDKFFEHDGINYQAIVRAMLANLRAGRTVQGGSTITQQVAKSFFLSSEKTFGRKIKEAMLATKLEQNLTKEEILYLYLNNIFFGAEAYGVAAAAETYFRKPLDQLTIAECALLGGLPQAPSRYSPIRNPQLAKDRQKDVIRRMRDVGFITPEQAEQAVNEPITVYLEKEYKEVAPDFVETVRQLLTAELGNDMVLHDGIKIYTSLDYDAQVDAQKQVRAGLKALDKRQGYRGAARTLKSTEETDSFLLATRKKLEREKAPIRVITRDGNVPPERPLALYQKKDASGKVISNLPDYVQPGKEVEAVVTRIDDRWGLTYVRFAETQALIDIADMGWARKPDAHLSSDNAPALKKPSSAFKVGDVILVEVMADQFTSTRLAKEIAAAARRAKTDPNALKDLPKFNEYAYVKLEQEPLVEGALLSIDQKTQDIIAMVGGYDFARSKFNRTIQALRQTGSAFKSIIYLSALDKGWHPGKIVADAPIVFEDLDSEAADGQEDIKKWKPHNYGNKFEGDMLFRQALVQSLNIPTVKILQDVGIPWAV
ncbi:MAG: transglycosylase domain-containing protein, partial [Bdellovibrionaceae bacterium]|nr:transglycosylase domain-containing protein [Pseudobdellovibrionaceae bacterium]